MRIMCQVNRFIRSPRKSNAIHPLLDLTEVQYISYLSVLTANLERYYLTERVGNSQKTLFNLKNTCYAVLFRRENSLIECHGASNPCIGSFRLFGDQEQSKGT